MKDKELSHSLEDYLESIYVISQSKKIVRVKDLVTKQKVKTASVIGALRKLEQKGYIEHEHYGHIELTPEGKTTAADIYEKHKTLFTFFTEVLDLDSETAELDACSMEHYMSKETFERFFKLVNFVKNCPDCYPKWLLNLKDYMNTGAMPDCNSCRGIG